MIVLFEWKSKIHLFGFVYFLVSYVNQKRARERKVSRGINFLPNAWIHVKFSKLWVKALNPYACNLWLVPHRTLLGVLSSTRRLPYFACYYHHYISLRMVSLENASYHTFACYHRDYISLCMFSVLHKSYLTFTFCHSSSSWHFSAIFATFVSMFSTFLVKYAHYTALRVNTYCCYTYVTATFQINCLCFK